MKKKIRIYTEEEMNSLLNSTCILGFRNNSQIIYKNVFKLYTIHERIYHPEKTAKQIFEEAGIDTSILDDKTPQRRINNWLKKYKIFGEDYFENEKQFYSSKQKNKLLNYIKENDKKENDKKDDYQNNTNEPLYYFVKITNEEVKLIPFKLL